MVEESTWKGVLQVRKVLLGSLIVFFIAAVFAFPAMGNPLRIGIMQIVDHPALDAARDGVMDALEEEYGYVRGEDIVYDIQSAQGDVATANTIARKFVSDQVDLIVSIATPTSQAAANATRDIPIVFSAVTDPVAAGLVQSLEEPGANVTGASDLTPVALQLELLHFLFPEIQTVGTMYNAGEVNSVITNDLAIEAVGEMGLELHEATVATTADVSMAARSLAGRAEAIYVSTDNTVVSALETVISVTLENKIPLVLADPTTVEQGALLALGFNYYLHGRQTASMVARILEGENPADIPVEFARRLELLVNRNTVEQLGLDAEEFDALLEEFVENKALEGIEVDLKYT